MHIPFFRCAGFPFKWIKCVFQLIKLFKWQKRTTAQQGFWPFIWYSFTFHIHGYVTVTIKRSYDQSKWRTPNTVSSGFRGFCQHGTSFVVHIAHGESHGTDWFLGCEKLQRQSGILQISGRENFGELIVTVTPGNRSLIVTAGYAWS